MDEAQSLAPTSPASFARSHDFSRGLIRRCTGIPVNVEEHSTIRKIDLPRVDLAQRHTGTGSSRPEGANAEKSGLLDRSRSSRRTAPGLPMMGA
jgi:hypothetical protein